MALLADKVALVTGGANGIGRACCERFAAEGAAVVVADLLDEPGAQAVADLEAAGAKALFVHYDATSPADNDDAVREAVEAFGSVDVLVTAAGVSHAAYRSGDASRAISAAAAAADPLTRFTEQPLDEWRGVLDVNLTGTFLALQATVRRMLAQGRGGSIITIASIAAKHPEAGTPAYGASKAAVWMLTKHLASLVGRAGIRVNSIGPGFIDTNMTAPLKDNRAIYDQFIGQVPLGRMGTPREVASAATFLASDESSYFTGELLHPDGGFYTD